MKLEHIISPSKEIFLDAGPKNISVTMNTWANGEGASLMVHGSGEGLPLRMAGAFRWEEWSVIQMALAIAQGS